MTSEHHIVLVVDDDPGIRGLLVEILSEEGFGVTSVGDGEQALRWLRAHPGDACVVLLDLMMPVMGGLEFLEIKENEAAIADVPVVIITASGDGAAAVRGHRIHAYLPKPFSILDLLAAVESCRTDASPSCPPALAA